MTHGGGEGVVRRRRLRAQAAAQSGCAGGAEVGLLRGGEMWRLRRCAGGGEVERRRRRDGKSAACGGSSRGEAESGKTRRERRA